MATIEEYPNTSGGLYEGRRVLLYISARDLVSLYHGVFVIEEYLHTRGGGFFVHARSIYYMMCSVDPPPQN